AAPPGARVWLVGPQGLGSIAEAASRARDGDVVEIEAGDYHGDVASWPQARLTIRGVHGAARLYADGHSAEGKAIWVLRHGDFDISNVDFIGARVPDRNGAGIRLESGHLRVRHCLFWDSQSGILTANDPAASLDVEESEFGYLGAGDGLSHGIYAGAIARLELRGSYLHHGNVGHLVKSRARVSRIEYNRITDEAGGRASYELDLPNGGDALVVGNLFEEDAGASNSTLVSFGSEGYKNPSNTLRAAFNTVVNDGRWGGTFVRVAPGAGAVSLRNNLWVGGGALDLPPGSDEAGNRKAQWSDFARPARLDFRPRAAAFADARLAAVDAALTPRLEYVHPLQLKPLAQPPRWPGAAQSAAP
ncbi:MAG: hypothetical protein KGM91_27380, partial [Burkholderiales bacterium]|nr:hypothetical protein [Burkholderiales bacterium]